MTDQPVRRLILLLATLPGATPKQIAGELAGRAAPMRQRTAGTAVTIVTGIQIENDPLRIAAGATGRDITPVGAIVEVTGPWETPEERLLAPVAGFGSSFGGVFDKMGSAAALGTVRTITKGPEGASLALVLGTRKLAKLSQAEFHEYWVGTHAPLALSLMPEGAPRRFCYEQLHADAAASARAAEVAGVATGDYAGVLQVRCNRPEDFLSVAAEPSFALAIYEDELRFADQSGMRGGFVRLDG